MNGVRWTILAAPLAGVALLGAGIAAMLRISYVQHPSWILVILPPVGAVLGSLLLIVPLLRRISREDAAVEESDRRFGDHPPESFYGHKRGEKRDGRRREDGGSRN
jgi:hypothetical protein